MRKILMTSVAATLLFVAPAGAQQGAKSSATQPGAVKEAVQGPERADFYTVRPADMAASEIIGMDVRNTANEDLGEVADVLIDDGKTIRAIVLDVGGFLGLGERRVAVTPASVIIVKESDGGQHALVNATKESLTSAPQFKVDNARRG
jgi:hypothetical protein